MSIATDKLNNVYITGDYSDTITFGSFVLTTNNVGRFYLAKYDSSGNVKWAKSTVNSSNAYCGGYSVCTDVFGNVYVTGQFYYTAHFGSYTLTSNGNDDIFLAKYDSSGNVLWAKSAGGSLYDYGSGLSTDRTGNVYVTGSFQSPTITFGPYTLTNAGSYDIFLAKYDSSGNIGWVKNFGGSGADEGYSVATDALANVYVTGFFTSPSISFGIYTLINAGADNIFLAKYDSLGNVLWAKNNGGTGGVIGCYVAADSSGNAYITGDYGSGSITFGSDTLINAGGNDAFLAKYTSSGNVDWAKRIGGIGNEVGWCVAVDKSNNVYVTGSFDSTSLTFDTITVQRPVVHNDPMFIAGYDSSGHALWAKALGSGGNTKNSVASSPSGCLYIGGDFKKVNPFIIGNDSLHLSGASDVFVAKLCSSQSGQYVSDVADNVPLSFFPNPFHNQLTITAQSNQQYEVSLFDVVGRLLLHRLFANQTTINTEQLAKGVYILQLKDGQGVCYNQKVVKE